ncbi:MAG: lipoprotein [Desulfobacterales bacterium]|nr:lipoprotein [Desulfobacterales bacterium]MCP4161310.1 lipoprotein [Deltaproteobacteria bacterium]
MKKIILVISLLFIVTGCSTVYSPASNNVNINEVDFSRIDEMKQGIACSYFIFGFGPFGETRLTQAIKNGSIKKVKAVEYENAAYPFYSKSCICVYGD